MIGGPVGDAGLTGRKIIVDTYGGMARHGGGAFSGKDPSKVDRSAAYAARYVAKNVVAAGLADRCEVQVAYAIGVAHPVSVRSRRSGPRRSAARRSRTLVDEHFDLRPGAFREYLRLHRPIYQKTAAYGHFGREDDDFTWERTDKAAMRCADAGRRRGSDGRRRSRRRARLPGRLPVRLARPPPTRSRAATSTTTGGRGSTRPDTTASSPPATRSTSATATTRTSRCWPASARTRTGCRSSGRGSSRRRASSARAALEHYRRVLGTLEQHGLTAFVTLHHFTLPRWLAERGGWLAPDAVERFARYSSASRPRSAT